jgi:hypothetical protein
MRTVMNTIDWDGYGESVAAQSTCDSCDEFAPFPYAVEPGTTVGRIYGLDETDHAVVVCEECINHLRAVESND